MLYPLSNSMKYFMLLFLLSNTQISFSQITEQNLVDKFKKIDVQYEYENEHPDANSGDFLLKANMDFQNALLEFGRNPSTITANLSRLKKVGVTIVDSPDRLFRIYSWDTQLGGTMHIFYNVYQYKIKHKVYTRVISTEEYDAGMSYFKIYNLKTSNKVYYLGVYYAIASTKYSLQGIKVFNISNTNLDHRVKLIKTSDGLVNDLDISFDFFSVVDRKERPVELITYNAYTKTIKVPVVDSKDKVTNRFHSYKFNGKYFLRQ